MLIPIYKVDEERRLVIGRAAQEVPDRAGEIMDYDTAKPAFKAWSDETFEASGGKSYGNVRAMHGNVAAGRLESIEFDDASKAIDVTAKIVDDNEWQKVLEGVYTGFSMGGKYVKRWKDDSGLTRYTPSVAEISIVDRPCVPTAQFAELVKTDGTVGQLMLKGADMDEETPATGEATEAVQEGEVAKTDEAKPEDAVTTEPPADTPPETVSKAAPLMADLKKYLGEEVWDACRAMSALQILTDLLNGEIWEAKEGEPEPAEQMAALRDAIARVKAFIVSEIQENHDEGAQTGDMAMSDAGGDMKKAAPDNGDHLATIYNALVAMGFGADATKAETGTDLTKAVEDARADQMAKFDADVVQPLAKAVGLAEGESLLDAVTKMVTERDELRTQKAEWDAKPADPKGVLKTVTKADDSNEPSELDALKERIEKMSPEQQAQEIFKFQMKHGGKRLL